MLLSLPPPTRLFLSCPASFQPLGLHRAGRSNGGVREAGLAHGARARLPLYTSELLVFYVLGPYGFRFVLETGCYVVGFECSVIPALSLRVAGITCMCHHTRVFVLWFAKLTSPHLTSYTIF